jgi:anti-sigma B factor antagonist
MSLEHETINDCIVVRLHGEFDAAASDAIRSELESLVNTTTGNIIFDLSDVSFIDSTGMGLIIYAFKRRQSAGGEFRVSGAQGQPLELFKLLRVDRVIKLFATTEEATALA